MATEAKKNREELVERHIMLAVDTSENSKRAVQFVGDFFGCYPAFRVTLLNIILEPAAAYFENDADHAAWVAKQRAKAEEALADYRRILVDSGFARECVHIRIEVMQGSSVGECVIREQDKLRCCTVVIGRRGISKKEEFIFGSTSSKILHDAKNCAVMVIE